MSRLLNWMMIGVSFGSIWFSSRFSRRFAKLSRFASTMAGCESATKTTESAEARPLWPIILSLVILSIPPLTRLVRANTIAYAQRDFVVAARSLGAKGSRILFREILPNIVPTLLTFALTGLALLIVAEGALAFLGLSVEAPAPTWGAMISAGSEGLRNGEWWPSLMPALALFLTVLSINLLGDVLAQRFNRREAIA